MINKAKDVLLEALMDEDLLEQVIDALKLDKDVTITGLIFETKNYDGFNKLPGNRKLDLNNVKNISESIEKNGYKKSQPITVDRGLNIIDGQHRKQSCENLGIKVPFVIETEHDDSLKLTQDLNSNQKNWKITDYINSYADRGFKDYILFNNFLKEEEISSSILIWLLYHSRNGVVQTAIKKGDLSCTKEQLDEIRVIIQRAREIREVIPSKTVQYKDFMKDKVLMPLITIMNEPEYSHERMIKQIREEYFTLSTSNMVNAGTSLVDIYNKKLSKKNRLKEYNRM